MSDVKIHVHGDAEQVITAMKRIREASTTPAMDAAAALQAANRLASLPSMPRRPWYRKMWPFDIERAAVLVIAAFVVWIAIDHHRQVNARVEAAKVCRDGAR